ncbi:MAG: hypothetical protein ACJZ33_04440, partial [Candidatus Poseidoniales archaeon]
EAATVVIVSHSLPILEQMCSRLILIEDGKIKAIGEPKEIIDIYKTTSKLQTKEKNLSKLITKEKPKLSLGKRIFHNLNLFLLLLLRIFGLSEWASSATSANKIKENEKEKIITENWGIELEKVKDTEYLINTQTKRIVDIEQNKESKKLTLVMLTCVWKRPRLTKIVMNYYSKLKEEIKDTVNLEFVAVGSEGKKSRSICEDAGFHYYEYENQPMSEKWQHGLEMTKKYNPDAVIIMGSDDIITKEIIDFYIGKINLGYLLIGIKDFYIYESTLKKLAHWRGYGKLNDAHRMDETIGLGRCLARPLLDKIKFDVWGGLKLKRNLDGAMTNRLKEFGIFPISEDNCPIINDNGKLLRIGHVGYKLNEMNGFAIDIKSKTNVTNFDRYLDRDPESVTFMDGGVLEEHIYEDTIEEIMALDGQE